MADSLKKIDKFSVHEGNPANNRDGLCSMLHDCAENFHTNATPSIPYLLYKNGDVEENTRKLNQCVEKLKKKMDETKKWSNDKKDEVNEIIEATKEAAASTGVATFTQEFHKESSSLESRSKGWLLATGIFAFITIGIATCLVWGYSTDPNINNIIHYTIGKITIIAVLLTCTIWCGRVYRALVHQSTVNKHKALSLKTFQAFVGATNDPYVKDAVLMAATKSIFSNVPTGFAEPSNDHDSGINFVEFGKSGEMITKATTDTGKASV